MTFSRGCFSRVVSLTVFFSLARFTALMHAELPTQLGHNGQRIPATLPHMYEHAFRVQNSLEASAVREERNGRSGTAFREMLRLRFQLSTKQFLSFESSAQRFGAAEQGIKDRMFTIIAAEKATPRETSAFAKDASTSMHALIVERDKVSADEVEAIHQALGPQTAQRLDAAITGLYSEAQKTLSNTAHPDYNGTCPVDPDCIYYDDDDDVPGPPNTDDGGGGDGGSTIIQDNTPILTGIDPSLWIAGKTTQVTFSGEYFGTNAPKLTLSPGGGIGYTLVSYNDTQIVANVNVASGTPNEDVDVTVTSTGYDGLGFSNGGTGASPTSSPIYATVHSSMNAPEITVIAWVNGNAPDLVTLPSGANSTLVSNLSNPDYCTATLADWAVGIRAYVSTAADLAYSNAWLVKKSANTAPPQTITPAAQQSAGNFRLFNDFGNGGGYYQIGNTPNPCGGGLPSAAPQASPYDGATGTTSTGQTYQLAEGRLGTKGQGVNATLNGRTTPWIWSVIEFNSSGTPTTTNHAMFPTYSVYKNGSLIATYPQSSVSTFILNNESYQETPAQVQ